MLWANDGRTEAKRMLLNEVEMLSFLSVCDEICPSARVVSMQTSCRVEQKWWLCCSFFSVCSNLSAWYQSLKCLTVVHWKHNTAKINSVVLQRKDRRINIGSKMAITFLRSEKFVTGNRRPWEKERKKMPFLCLGTTEDFNFICYRERAAISKVQHQLNHLQNKISLRAECQRLLSWIYFLK